MAKPEKSVSMGAAECARRTGLTVRALRVYQRHGLIEPKRTGKGWRCYGPRELQQLNVIVTLKAFGMTLTQIRALLETKRPPLARVLQMQLRVCSARRDAVERALALVRAALATIGSGKTLSLEALCNLTGSMEMGTEMDTGHLFATVRGLINEKLTPEEERAHMNWLSSRPSEELTAAQEYRPAMRAALRSLQDLQEKKVDPSAPEAQALIVQLKDVGGRYGRLKMGSARFEWNPSIGQKLWEVQARSYWVGMNDDFAAYLRAANAAAPWSKALTQVADEAAKLVEHKVEPTSEPGQALAKRLALICSDYSLGDPLGYARWAPYSPFRRSADEKENAALTSVWAFLASALEAAAPGARPNGMEMKNLATAARELMNEGLSPDEERAVMNWVAARPPEELKATTQGFLAPARAVFRALQDLREKKVDPAAPEVQALIDEWNQIVVRCQVRNRRAAMLEWNPSIALRWAEISARTLLRGISSEQETTPDQGLWAYFRAAQAAAPWHQALTHVTEEAAKLMDGKVDPASAPAQALAKRLALICSDHSLGDALLYARSAPVMQFLKFNEVNARTTGTWAYLASALRR
jgi:MerR family transcriptional regulator, thiopeptide resistance regulator